MRKLTILSILLSLCLIAGMSQAALASTVTVATGTTEARIPFSISTTKGNFAGIQFTVSFTGGLELRAPALNSDIFSHGQPITVEKSNGDLYIGMVTSGNYYEPSSSGQIDVCDLVFTYTGTAPQSVTLYDIKITRLIDLNTTEAEEYGPMSFQIERGAGGSTVDPGTNPPPGGGGGNPGDGSGGGGNTGDGNGDGTGTGGDTELPTNLGETQNPAGGSTATNTSKIVYAPFISGYPDGTVKPDGQLARAELAQLIYNLYGSGSTNNIADYSDMDQSHWAFNAVGFCQTRGFMLGYPEGDFKPEQTVTRAELSTALVRIKGLTLTPDHPFTDIGSDHWAIEFIGAASAGGLVLGYPDGTFQPENAVTRAEAVTMICRAEERDETLFDMTKEFSDLAASFWGYNYIMNAANGYNYNG